MKLNIEADTTDLQDARTMLILASALMQAHNLKIDTTPAATPSKGEEPANPGEARKVKEAPAPAAPDKKPEGPTPLVDELKAAREAEEQKLKAAKAEKKQKLDKAKAEADEAEKKRKLDEAKAKADEDARVMAEREAKAEEEAATPTPTVTKEQLDTLYQLLRAGLGPRRAGTWFKGQTTIYVQDVPATDRGKYMSLIEAKIIELIAAGQIDEELVMKVMDELPGELFNPYPDRSEAPKEEAPEENDEDYGMTPGKAAELFLAAQSDAPRNVHVLMGSMLIEMGVSRFSELDDPDKVAYGLRLRKYMSEQSGAAA